MQWGVKNQRALGKWCTERCSQQRDLCLPSNLVFFLEAATPQLPWRSAPMVSMHLLNC
ncbi:hypothetical protein PAHAL_8G189700 [Panicum hallii]|uniref:Uncharacterized protein n=1 Tax=Panicum hallii TaxID=206008 RepID=A0A2T8I9D3_9POAL|nr:hypothetical protein PAHAL_8G189700 [Panicum hallii]